MLKKLKAVKAASRQLALLTDAQKSQFLIKLADSLRKHLDLILEENAKDLAKMSQSNPMYDRLLLSAKRIESMAADLCLVAKLAAPTGKIINEIHRPNGLRIQQKKVPLGVVAVIYESRPNVTVDVFSLCFKTGNACILKGGKEAYYSNSIFVKIITELLAEQGLDENIVYLLPPDREATQILLSATGLIDVCIPRGSQALIDFVREHAKIPVIETGAGIVHVYFDANGEVNKGRLIIDNAKTRRVSVCNAMDTLIIHEQRLGDLPLLTEALGAKKVEIFADPASYAYLQPVYPKELLHAAVPEDYGQEFLSYKMSIKTVPTLAQAIEHISQYSSGHSESIITEDKEAASYFLEQVDAAAVYLNASTAFTDGGQFGMGAEIGISTQKLHARGPMALDALTSYKWIIYGDGQIREE